MPATPFANAPLLGRIPAHDLRALAREALKRSFAAGGIIFLRGDLGDGLYAIVSGSVRVVIEGGSGDVILGMRGAGDVLGEMSLLDGMPRSATARAIDDVTALFVSKERFRAWVAEHPAAAEAMLQVLALRLRQTTDQVAGIALQPVEARVARALWVLLSAGGAAQRGASMRVNQGELARSIGVTRESVNKHLARLKRAGVIETSAGRVTLLDPAALRALGEEV